MKILLSLAFAIAAVLPLAAQSPIPKVTAAPTTGTSEVQTLTIGGTPTGGTFKLKYDAWETDAISWSATNSTLVANIDGALEKLPAIGVGGVTTATGTMTSGIGTITLTFSGKHAKEKMVTILVSGNTLTGTSPTLAIAKTTPGVKPVPSGIPAGDVFIDVANGIAYQNTGTYSAPVFTKLARQAGQVADMADPSASFADLAAARTYCASLETKINALLAALRTGQAITP